MRSFGPIEARAAKRKGGKAALAELLPTLRTPRAIARTKDAKILSLMTKGVFRAGFVWSVVENKWPGFETVFHGFDVGRLAALDEDGLDAAASDERIIRNRTKVYAARDNARWMVEVAAEHGSFAKWLARWPADDQVGLMAEMKRDGSRLGGVTGQYFLREVGWDAFILARDVNKALIQAKVIDKPATSKKALSAVQAAFNAWREETGHPYAHLSRILACSVP